MLKKNLKFFNADPCNCRFQLSVTSVGMDPPQIPRDYWSFLVMLIIKMMVVFCIIFEKVIGFVPIYFLVLHDCMLAEEIVLIML